MTETKWFDFEQNNSGGVFTGPAIKVLVEAQSKRVAMAIAEDNEIYFNGCENGIDCECCGDRWREPWDEDGAYRPLISGVPPQEFVDPATKPKFSSPYWGNRRGKVWIPEVLLIHADGRREEFFAPKDPNDA
jgi:hypothetical protein